MSENWERGKLADYIQDFVVPQRDKPKSFEGSIPWCRIEDIDGAYLSKSKSGKCVTEEVIREMPLRVFPLNTVIVSCSADLGRCAIVSAPLVTNQTFIGLVPKTKLLPKYLYHLMTSRAEELNAAATGATIKYLSQDKFKALDISVPPILEQRRIVGILDEALEGIATAKANAEKNLRSSRALFDSHLNSVFSQRGEGWVEKAFEDVIESNVIGLTKNSGEQGENKTWPYVKMNNITRDNRFDFSSYTCVDATAEEVRKYSLSSGDFLFNTRNSYELVGKSCIYESDSRGHVLFNNNIMRVRFGPAVDARFVLQAFSSKGVAEKLEALKSGTTNVSAIYFKDLRSLNIPVPPLAVQKRVALKLDLLRVETRRLESVYERKLTSLDALKKSLLHQAFTGHL